MKRLSLKRKLYLLRRARGILRRKYKQAVKKSSRNSHRLVGFKVLQAPKFFEISANGNRHELLTFLDKLRQLLVVEKAKVQLDFTMTAKMWSGGTLLFLSELHRCKALLGGTMPLRCRPPRNVKVAQVLKQIGAYDLMHYPKRINPSFSDVIHWRYASGHQVEGQKYENILGSYEGRVAETLLGSLFRGITEAMTNCHHHAYIGVRPDGLDYQDVQKNWWMFSQEKEGFLTVVFCDLGVGIPNTLPTKKPGIWQRIMSAGKAGSDSNIIEKAVEDSVSRTGKRYRGKGLKQLLEAVQDTQGGALQIFSNRGCYTFAKGKVTLKDFTGSIMGTLIQWKVPIIQQELF